LVLVEHALGTVRLVVVHALAAIAEVAH
jgi:hypothetical protein